MNSPESDLEPAKSSLQIFSADCARLSNAAGEHCHDRNADALCIFLQTHLCICKRKASSQVTHSMNALNAAFASKMAEVYHCYKRRSVKKENVKISPLWVKAFNAYMDDSAVIIVLAQMAAAHILGDLETLIFLNPVTREEYDQVFDDIADCVAITTNGQISSGSFIDQLYRCMQPVVDPFRNWAVSTMRKRAWHMYEERIRFSQR